MLRATEPISRKVRASAPSTARWPGSTERLNGEDGLGAIYPAMANSVMMFDALGYPPDHPLRAIARRSIEKLLVVHPHEAYCQPCVSPIWDTGLAAHALLETGDAEAQARVAKALQWLEPMQVLDVKGDWIARRPDVRPGGWAFQYANPHYPDVDDTAVVAMAMERAQGLDPRIDHRAAIARARRMDPGPAEQERRLGRVRRRQRILLSQQHPVRRSRRAARSADRGRHRALRVDAGAVRRDAGRTRPRWRRGVDYLKRTQLAEGSWYGRWGMNYIYGTWSVLCALNAAGVDHAAPEMRKAADWLIAIQNADGGWGEDGSSYKLDYKGYEPAPSTASQTAWALLGLMATGDIDASGGAARHRLSA